EMQVFRGGSMSDFPRISILTLALFVGGCATTSAPPDSAASAGQAVAGDVGDYRIGADDRVQVTVWRNPELSINTPVRPDGKISVPIIGDVEAGGRTPSEVAETI